MSSLSAREARDVLYLEYMSAYEEYVRLELEMAAQLREGHIALSKARRDLSAKHISLGKTLYPCEFSALLKVVETDEADDGEADDGGSRGPMLRVHTVTDAEAEAAEAAAAAKKQSEEAVTATTSVVDAESAALAELRQWGVGGDLQREIAAAVTDFGEEVGVSCGDVLVTERRDGSAGGDTHAVRSVMAFSASSGMDELKRAQFRAALANNGGNDDGRKDSDGPRPQMRPSSHRDPIRWYTLLPPPALRQAQLSFRRAAETAVQCANAQAKMQSACAHLEASHP